MKHSLKDWWVATRYWSFPVSAMPVIVTFMFLCCTHRVEVSWVPFLNALLALVGMVIIHFGGNMVSDYFDYKTGVDNEEAFAVPNLVHHRFEPKEYILGGSILMAFGACIGIALTLITALVMGAGWWLLLIGGIGVLLAALYPVFKYHALGDAYVFTMFGIMPMIGTTFVVCGHVVWESLLLAVPMGIITISVLHANNTLDIESDAKAGIRTVAMMLGVKASAFLYMIYMCFPFVWVLGTVIIGFICPSCGIHWTALLCLATLPKAFSNLKLVRNGWKELGKDCMKGMDLASAQLQLMFSASLAVGLLIGTWI